MKRPVFLCLAAVVCCLSAAPAGAQAASRLTVRGAGFGHGVGMSQYGAYGFARHGVAYDEILRHYYSGTELGRSGASTVRVLLQGSVARSTVRGASSAGGRRLNPGTTYAVAHGSGAGEVVLLSPRGKVLRRATGVLRVSGARLALGGVGTYRGALEYRPSSAGGVQAVNAVGMEDYVRGVVARESPSSWPAEALKAQAVAARTYALTTSKGGNGFDQYPDTRSQVYGGVAAETASTDAAVRATTREVVTYDGEPVTTYFFSTSGGRTESVEKSVLGTTPLPWLKSVKDPYDDLSPKHRWGPFRWSKAFVASKLSGLVRGRLRGIDVRRRGDSPRIVSADVVGTGGRTRVTGATLRARLGLFDTWAYFTTISSGARSASRQVRFLHGAGAGAGAPATRRITGEVFPASTRGSVTIEQQVGGRWRAVCEATTDRGGRYVFASSSPGRYRVRYLADVGPVVTLR